ncbi:amino acid ABC transporter permease [Pseudorhodoplanes sinuspersici]|uniref:Amino acid ABC transporter permease n=1 Tax=Pseudorhodoplanes sinuspersici TaxID=1235591 RepID=A0A1W6ZX46_9HYPH|nr:amino acid ABC transporter permease [Pseudorhodoplanes sinuspersici]ARQ01848.1 amino acid ABC transporter permease [Pseudorhodoplanes sinuspersici]RKE73607.1 amino acid ABC transporter membrane protein 1 (PAAT family) [Pseudorhodoplanes sinuspersici]
MADARGTARPQVSPINDPRWRSAIVQVLLCLVIAWLAYGAITNAADNLARARIASGFDFWNSTAGFDISQTLIPYTTQSTYGRAFWVGLLNTLLVASLGIVFATIIGFAIGILQLSKNVLVSRLAAAYVEIIRNLPLLLQLLFWYNAVLKALPNLRESITIPGGAVLNNRGLFLPRPIFGGAMDFVLAAFGLGVIGAIAFRHWARRRQALTGEQSPVFIVALSLIVVLPLVVFVAAGIPVTFEQPEMGRFNISGGIEILPEFAALLFGLSIYTAAFIAEVVRAGIQAVSQGQTEAAFSLGLRPGPTLRLIVIPQAMRVIVPPLTNQYLNLTKNSSLAVAIGYPDLVQVFTGTVLNQTGQAVEVVAITMAVYLTISLITSGLMNLYNRRFALKER